MNKKQLLPCGCGGEAKIYINYSFGQETYYPVVHISCLKCGISTQPYIGKELVWHPWYGEEPVYRKEASVIAKAEAISAWNKAMSGNANALKREYERGYADGKAKQRDDDEVSRRWEESYRESQMPWNHYTEMGE